MNPSIKQRWLEALPNYRQGTGSLRPTENTYCCLGVLCTVAAQDDIGKWDGCTFDCGRDHDGFVDKGDSELPRAVFDWAGIDSCASINLRDRENILLSLALLNDQGFTFAQISDLIKFFL